MNVTETLGERINGIRKSQNLSQSAFGKKFGVKYQMVSAWENDSRIPSMEILQEMANGFGCSFYWLVTGNDDENHVVCEQLGLANATINRLKEMKNPLAKAVIDRLVDDWSILIHLAEYLNSDFKTVQRKSTVEFFPVSDLSGFNGDDLETVNRLRLLDDFKRIREENKGGKEK